MDSYSCKILRTILKMDKGGTNDKKIDDYAQRLTFDR